MICIPKPLNLYICIYQKTWNCNHLLQYVLSLFVSIKIYFFLNIFRFYLIYSLCGYSRNKPAPGDQESSFKKFGAIPSEPSKSK